jgi:GNAT superfamily N-acetyltransferase
MEENALFVNATDQLRGSVAAVDDVDASARDEILGDGARALPGRGGWALDEEVDVRFLVRLAPGQGAEEPDAPGPDVAGDGDGSPRRALAQAGGTRRNRGARRRLSGTMGGCYGVDVDGHPASVRQQAARGTDRRRAAVDEAARGRGVGSLLLRAVLQLAIQMADDLGCVGVVVDAKPGAVAFYEKLGFLALEVVAGELGDRPRPQPMFLELGNMARRT